MKTAIKEGAVQTSQIKVLAGANIRAADDEGMGELTASVGEYGILEPLIVSQGKGNDFILVAGHRRLEAAKQAGLSTVPVRVFDLTEDEAFDLTEDEAQEVQAIENIH